MRYEYSEETGYITLMDIELAGLPDELVVEGQKLVRKSEFHVSIMAIKRLAPLIGDRSIDDANKLLADIFFDFVQSHSMMPVSLRNEFRLVKRDERVTLVAMVDMPYLDDLFLHLGTICSVTLPTQPAHITLYTLQREKGIGLLSQDEVNAESSAVDVPELAEIKLFS